MESSEGSIAVVAKWDNHKSSRDRLIGWVGTVDTRKHTHKERQANKEREANKGTKRSRRQAGRNQAVRVFITHIPYLPRRKRGKERHTDE